MRRGALAALFAVAACHARAPASVAPAVGPGVTIALYDTYALVDDRREVELAGGTLVLEHVDPGAALASLELEPLGAARGKLHVGTCAREGLPAGTVDAPPLRDDADAAEVAARVRATRELRFEDGHAVAEVDTPARSAPAVRCAVTGPPGRYLVRLVYVSTALRYRAEHAVTMTEPDRARVSSRFAIATPAWHTRAELVVYDGVPGGARVPREIVRGPAELDGSVAVLALPPRDVPAQLRRIYDGAPPDAASPHAATGAGYLGHAAAIASVWVWLELRHLRLARGALRVHVELPGEDARDADVPAGRAEQADTVDAPVRVPLWIDPALRGMRQRFADYAAGASLAERFLLTVANTGGVAREVWIEEPLRPQRRHHLERAWPGKPVVAGDLVRARVTVAPGKLARVGFTVAYQ